MFFLDVSNIQQKCFINLFSFNLFQKVCIMNHEREILRRRVADTIMMLCKNGLQYRKEIKVQGVIAISLDEEIALAIHINDFYDKLEESYAKLNKRNHFGSCSVETNTSSVDVAQTSPLESDPNYKTSSKEDNEQQEHYSTSEINLDPRSVDNLHEIFLQTILKDDASLDIKNCFVNMNLGDRMAEVTDDGLGELTRNTVIVKDEFPSVNINNTTTTTPDTSVHIKHEHISPDIYYQEGADLSFSVSI